MKNVKKALAMLLALSMAASMAACSTPAQKTEEAKPAETQAAAAEGETAAAGEEAAAETASGEKVFRYATNTEPTTLDSCKANSVADNEILRLCTEGLVRNSCGTITPGIAETWDISDDGLVYTFHLRDASWPDGQAITAGDFEYALKRLADPETASPYAWILDGLILNGDKVTRGEMSVDEFGVKAIDDKTLEITLDHAQGYFISLIGSCVQFTPQRQDIIEQFGETYAADASKMMTYGPFIMTSSDSKVYKFEKNPEYWDAASINFDKIEMSIVETGETQLAMYEAGELDFVQVPNTSVALYDDQDDVFMSGGLDWVYINHETEHMNNQNFRLALNYALDRVEYNLLANSGVYQGWGNIVLPAVDGVSATYGEEVQPEGYPLEGDTDKAVEYLNAYMAEAGIANAADIEIEFVTTDAESNKKIAEVLQERWQTVLGINVKIRQVTYGEIYGTVYPSHDFQCGYGGWAPDYADPYTYLSLFLSYGQYNYENYKNADFDAAMEASITETDPAARLQHLADAEKILIEDGCIIPLQYRTVHYLMDEDVKNVNFYFIGYTIDLVYGDCDPT